MNSNQSSTSEPETVDVIERLFTVVNTLRPFKLSRNAYTTALMSVSSSEPLLATDPVMVAAAVFRNVVLHDQHHLPTSSNSWPPYRFGTGRTLWGSAEEAMRTLGTRPDFEDSVRQEAIGLITELMEEGGFLPSKDPARRIRSGNKNQIGQLLSKSSEHRNDGSVKTVSIVKYVGDRDFTIHRMIGDNDAIGSEDIEELKARNNIEVIYALGADEPSTLDVCLEFGMKSHSNVLGRLGAA